MEELKQPYEIIGHNRCPYCGNYLMIVDSEMSYMSYDSEGYPTDLKTAYYRCEAVCMTCKSVFPMKRNGLKYVPAGSILDLEDQYLRKQRLERD